MTSTLPAYAIVTPVKDEARFIGRTLRSVLEQTHRPWRWIIVDDGSTDGTAEIIDGAVAGLDWVTVVRGGPSVRALGSAEVLAFDRGFAGIARDPAWRYVVKLDGDVDLEPDYFARLLAHMEADPRWGIASGVYRELQDGAWHTIGMPAYHAAGASKTVRRACFEQIGGFVARKGWDTVDELRAGIAGWRTGHFDDLAFKHLKPEGAAMGTLATHRFHGEIYYQTGGGAGFLLAKSLHRMVSATPPVLGGLALFWGWLSSVLRREPRLVTPAEARYYRSLLRRRLAAPVSRLIPGARA